VVNLNSELINRTVDPIHILGQSVVRDDGCRFQKDTNEFLHEGSSNGMHAALID